MKEARGELLVFLDDDAFVHKDYLKNLEHQFTAHPDMAAFGGKITPLYENGQEPSWMSRWSYSWVSALNMGKEVRLFAQNAFPIEMCIRDRCNQHKQQQDQQLRTYRSPIYFHVHKMYSIFILTLQN